MTVVKKQFEELYTLLVDNKNKKVSTVLPQLIELMAKKNNASGKAQTFIKDEDGNVTHVYCYYHKKWEDVTVAEYGSKKGTATGLNTMCKEGVSNWTKQQRAKKQAEAELITKVVNGELLPEDLKSVQDQLIEDSKIIVPRADGHGTDEL
jgi:hypothetical protein